MNNKKRLLGIFGTIGLLILILDSKTAISGGQEGIRLCLQTVIPALFPFFILSSLVCQGFLGKNIPLLKPLSKLCGIPRGAESLLLLGFLGGYPVGAKNIVSAEECGSISRNDARRMLGFCNNAGPAFLFGMAGSLFERRFVPWILWLIHILSALIIGCILPGRVNTVCKLTTPQSTGIMRDMENAVRTMANVCAWVILFRVILSFADKWFFFPIPAEIRVLISGLTELSNGVIALHSITNDGLRFILCAGLLGFGGLCVTMQTASICGTLGTGYYFPGKVIQSCISIFIAYFLQNILFIGRNVYTLPVYWLLVPLLGIAIGMLIIHPRKNNSRNLSRTYV